MAQYGKHRLLVAEVKSLLSKNLATSSNCFAWRPSVIRRRVQICCAQLCPLMQPAWLRLTTGCMKI